jgi:hypothetical protein
MAIQLWLSGDGDADELVVTMRMTNPANIRCGAAGG